MIHAIFDTGSQCTYLTERARDALNLMTVRKVPMMMKTFGQNNGTVQICDLVRFIVKGSEGDSPVLIEAYVVPVICASLQGQNIEHAKQTYLHLNGLKLADETCEQQDAEIDLLVGSDQMWQFFSGQKISGKSGVCPVAFETLLGWVLSGPVEGKYDPKLLSASHYFCRNSCFIHR